MLKWRDGSVLDENQQSYVSFEPVRMIAMRWAKNGLSSEACRNDLLWSWRESYRHIQQGRFLVLDSDRCVRLFDLPPNYMKNHFLNHSILKTKHVPLICQ